MPPRVRPPANLYGLERAAAQVQDAQNQTIRELAEPEVQYAQQTRVEGVTDTGTQIFCAAAGPVTIAGLWFHPAAALAPSGTVDYSTLRFLRVTVANTQRVVFGAVDSSISGFEAGRLRAVPVKAGPVLNRGESIWYDVIQTGAGAILPAGLLIVAFKNARL